MNMFYEQPINGGISSNIVQPHPSLPPPSQLPNNAYYNYLSQTQSNNLSNQNRNNNSQDFLNSSQTEKSWLNSSLNENNWLNNSINLPSEQRFQSLNEMVTKIVEDEKSLLASGNASTLLSFKAMASHKLQHPQQQSFQIHQGPSIPLYRQESSKSRESSSLNSSFNSIFSPSHYNPFNKQNQKLQESQFTRKQDLSTNYAQINTKNINLQKNSLFKNLKQDQFNENMAPVNYPKIDERFLNYYQSQNYQQNEFYPEISNEQINYSNYFIQNNTEQLRPPLNNLMQVNSFNPHIQQNISKFPQANYKILNKNFSEQQQIIPKPYQRPNEIFFQGPSQFATINHQNNQNFLTNNLGQMPLAFPPSCSHQLATLSLDQQKYLLEQQRALVLTLAATEHMAQLPLNQQGFYPNQMYQPAQYEQENYDSAKVQNYPSQQKQHEINNVQNKSFNLNMDSNLKTTNSSLTKANLQSSQPIHPKDDFVAPPGFFSTQKTSDPIQEQFTSNNINMKRNNSNNNFQKNFQNGYHHFNKNISFNSNNDNTDSKNLHYQKNSPASPFMPQDPFMFHNINLNEFQKLQTQLNPNKNGEYNGALDSMMNDSADLSQIPINNEKLRLIPKQPYRHHRRTGPANELHVRLEECLYQFKCLEAERKKIETELYHINLNKKPQLNNNITSNVMSITRLPPNPSRVDRLIVESAKEYIRVTNLIARIENLRDTVFFMNIQTTFQKWLDTIIRVYSKRREELINNANRQRLGQQSRIIIDDKDVIELASAINDLCMTTSRTRTSLWCSLQISNVNYKQMIGGSLNANSNVNESIFNNLFKINEFMKRTFEIKTDMVESEKTNAEKMSKDINLPK